MRDDILIHHGVKGQKRYFRQNEDIARSKYISDKKAYIENMNSDAIAHHGVKGQKWGVRRYLNSLSKRRKAQYKSDALYWGKKNALYIQKQQSKGKTRSQALLKSADKSITKGNNKRFLSGTLAVGSFLGSLAAASTISSAIDSGALDTGKKVALSVLGASTAVAVTAGASRALWKSGNTDIAKGVTMEAETWKRSKK